MRIRGMCLFVVFPILTSSFPDFMPSARPGFSAALNRRHGLGL
jgi:hypothetical protein